MTFKRILKLAGYFLLGLIITLAVGRLAQKTLDSIYVGERAPYLQMPAPDAISLRWQSDKDYRGHVQIGLRSTP